MLTMEMVLHKDVDFAPKFGKNLKTFENSCHSLHGYYNCLIINISTCNDKQKRHVTNVTFQSSDISDMRKIATLHGRTLVFNGL